MKAVVYTKHNCQACTATLRWLTARGVEFEIRGAVSCADELRRLGHKQAPVVLAETEDNAIRDHWSGHRPDKLAEVFGDFPKEAA